MTILKHADFEVPGFGEFASPPTTAAITQSVGTAPPQLPGQTVMRIDPAGAVGFLIHDLGSSIDVLHTRMMINTSQASGGAITFLAGLDGIGLPVWLLTLDAANHSLSLAAGASQCSVDLPTALDWHTIELKIDSLAGTIALRLNGIERDSAAATLSPTRQLWMGIALTIGSIVGPIDIDHWVLANAPIGLPIATPEFDHAGDPRRWLVVYNRDVADSIAWAEAYRARRGVPYANLCGLSLPTDETITPTEYQAMRQAIIDYLADNNLSDQVVGVLLGFGVPGYADLAALSAPTAIANYLHTDAADGLAAVNPLHQDPVTSRPSASDYSGVRLTGRVDAPDLASALALLDRADALANEPLAHDQGADILIDINTGDAVIGPVYTGMVDDWASEQTDHLRLPVSVFDNSPPESVSNDAVVWGWRDAAPPSGYFATPAGRRVLCQQFSPLAVPATSVRNASATDWLNTAIQAGYAAAAAPSRPYSLSALPLPHVLFEALRRGWTLAEAWLLAKPFLRDGLQLIGDPLMTVGFPKAGFDVFGPVDRLDQIDFDQPLAVLHAGQHALQLDASDAPPADAHARYLVRRYDEHGRADLTSASIDVALEQDTVLRPALPAWPGFASWRVREAHGRINMAAVWTSALCSLGIDRVDLFSQAGSDDPVLLDQRFAKRGQKHIRFTIDRPNEPTRYRFRVVQGPAAFDTPWSAWVQPAPPADASLTLLETQP